MWPGHGLLGVGPGLVQGFERVRSTEELSRMNVRDLATARKLDGDVGGGDVVWKFGEHENVERIDGEEGGADRSP